jgi:hypothetical protein
VQKGSKGDGRIVIHQDQEQRGFGGSAPPLASIGDRGPRNLELVAETA